MHGAWRSLLRSTVSTVAVASLFAPHVGAQKRPEITLATTTSTQDTGLLDSLLPMFTRATGIGVKPIAVGTGAALEMARRGDADAVLVHAPEAEDAYVQSGDLISGRLIMHNDFLILGPADDPAHVRSAQGLPAQMRAIAAAGAFVSRGDGSGTERKELALWKAAGVSPASMPRREETGQGMGATLLVADARNTYTLTDRGTYLAFKDRLTLVPLIEGDSTLRNVYHAYVVNPGRHPTAHRSEAERFVRYLTEPDVQAWIGRFGQAQFGQPLFVPDADATALGRRAG
jgi:tungstate transport system substrate-binding protein